MSLYSQTILKIQPLDEGAMEAARERQAQLTKPEGSVECGEWRVERRAKREERIARSEKRRGKSEE
jgi:hypothetical protein